MGMVWMGYSYSKSCRILATFAGKIDKAASMTCDWPLHAYSGHPEVGVAKAQDFMRLFLQDNDWHNRNTQEEETAY